MSARLSTRFAFAVAALWLALEVLGLVLLTLTRATPASDSVNGTASSIGDAVVATTYAVVGLVLASRRPRNAIGWLFLAVSLCLAFVLATERYAVYALVSPGSGSLPGGSTVAALSQTTFIFLLTAVALVLLLFPYGTLPSRSWRPVPLILLVIAAVSWAGGTLTPGKLPAPYGSYRNPLGVGVLDSIGVVLFWTALGIAPLMVAASVSLVRRFRRSRGIERQQYKWFTFAAALLPLTLIAAQIAYAIARTGGDALSYATAFAAAVLPVSTGIAILKYRLYEIDRVINRTLVYGTLTVILGVAYAGLVLLGQAVFSSFAGGSNLTIAMSTLVVAALFLPMRSRVQGFVDRRFYRQRYDAQRTLDVFGSRLREQVDLETLQAELRSVVGETMQPAHVAVWLRGAG